MSANIEIIEQPNNFDITISEFPNSINVDITSSTNEITVNIVETTLASIGAAGTGVANTFTENNTFLGDVNISGDLTISGEIIGLDLPYLPLSGGTMTGNIDFDTGEINNVDKISFNTLLETEPSVGEIGWNTADGTLEVGLQGNLPLPVGEKQVMYVKAAEDIKNGQAVYASDVSGDGSGNIVVSLFAAGSTDPDPMRFVGVATQDIDANNFGYVATFGKVKDVLVEFTRASDDPEHSLPNNQGWEIGTILYISDEEAGKYTSVAPSGGRKLAVAIIISKNGNKRRFFVRAKNGEKLSELHDVTIIGVGQDNILVYDNGSWTASDTATLTDVTVNTLTVNASDNQTNTFNSIVLNQPDTMTVNDGLSIDWYSPTASRTTAQIRSNAVGSSSDQLEFYTSEDGTLTKTLTLGNNATFNVNDMYIGSKKVVAIDSTPDHSDLLVYNDNIDKWVSSPVLFSDGSDPYSPYSIATQQKLMKGGYKFRQMVMVNSQFSGGNPNTVADGYNVLGMKAQIGGVANQTASCYTFDNIRVHNDISASTMPMIQDLDLYFHGCGLRFTADGNWRARVNIGVGNPTRIPQFSNFNPDAPARCGVEFDYVPADTYFRCRLFFVDQNEIENYSTYKYLPMYSASQTGGWAGYVYSMRLKQTVTSSNSLYLEFFMNEATSNVGGDQLPDVPLVALNVGGIQTPRRYSGRYVNFEVVSDPFNDPTNIVSLQTASMFCQYR